MRTLKKDIFTIHNSGDIRITKYIELYRKSEVV